MPDSGEANTSSSAVSFARVWAGLTARTVEDAPAWLGDGLGEDVATLTYDEALRKHGRMRVEGVVSQGDAGLRAGAPEDTAPAMASRVGSAKDAVACEAGAQDRTLPMEPAGSNDSRKTGSITVRMSAAECAQLHARAAAAGMTLSAYLRSCVFEAESLRAQVKEALAELRATGPVTEKRPVQPEHGRRLSWLVSRWRGGAGVA